MNSPGVLSHGGSPLLKHTNETLHITWAHMASEKNWGEFIINMLGGEERYLLILISELYIRHSH